MSKQERTFPISNAGSRFDAVFGQISAILMILLAILSRFVLVVDSMYRNRVRKIVVSTQIVRYFCCLIKKGRHMNLSKLSKTFAVYLI